MHWDANNEVYSIEMGGLGPIYEHCIQVTAAEMLRWFIDNKCNAYEWFDVTIWKLTCEKLDQFLAKNQTIKDLQLSMAQYGAALSIASSFYKRGAENVLIDTSLTNRLIKVRKFPNSSYATA